MTSTPLQGGTRPDVGHLLLRGAPDAVALVTEDRTLSYAELEEAVAQRAERLGGARRLVLLEASNDVDSVVTYLAALAGRHPVILVGPGDAARHGDVVERYRPGVIARGDRLEECPGDGEGVGALHPDLAVLLSTSGSTGSPKLVRLSRDNLVANAASIADYLGLRPTDRAMTSLPLHYCYGLSVLNSHLLTGAAVVLTGHSVADECFWQLFDRARATSFAGVPYTFDLLDASGFERRRLPSLRLVTQAGGRMAPEQVRRHARLGRERGWDLFVMYGQTEATARMAYLPPDLAEDRPEAIGVPIPGGSFRLDPVPGLPEDLGELVYSGPNVMMGYAAGPLDLARGPELGELRTGDLARQCDDGLWEITGRLSRFGKVFGLRLDLDRLEEQAGPGVRLVAPGSSLHAFTDSERVARDLRGRVARLAAVPAAAVQVHVVDELARTANGKVDYAALTRHATAAEEVAASTTAPADGGASPAALRDLYAVLLGRPEARGEDTFVSLGGDSLSFVEVSMRLADRLGELPAGWQHLTIAELAERAGPRRRWTTPVELPAMLRAVAILMVLLTHTDIVQVPGGAHLLLALVGYNLARFVLPQPHRRVRRLLGALAAVAVPSALWIGGAALVTGDYRPTTALLLNGVVGTDRWSPDWQFWFLEAVVWGCAGLAALLAVPRLGRAQRAHPFGFALAVTVAALTARYAWVGVEAGPVERYSVGPVLWCVALGWVAYEARSRWQRATVAALALTAGLGFFGDLQRELTVVAAVVLLLAVRTVTVPRLLATPLRVVGAASLWIYLTHWQVYPALEAAGHPYLAVAASLLVGTAAERAWITGSRALRSFRRGLDGKGPQPSASPAPPRTRRSTRIDPSASTSSNAPEASAGR